MVSIFFSTLCKQITDQKQESILNLNYEEKKQKLGSCHCRDVF